MWQILAVTKDAELSVREVPAQTAQTRFLLSDTAKSSKAQFNRPQPDWNHEGSGFQKHFRSRWTSSALWDSLGLSGVWVN